MNEPRNLETPLSDLFSTKADKFFVRSHFAVPEVDAKNFKLTVEGHVEKKLELTLDDLKKMEAVSREIVLECAGNGRVFLVPQARGLQWGHGRGGSGRSGPAFHSGAVLERAKVKAGAGDVVLIGADKGAIADPATPGTINFDRGIPLAKAKKDETLLVWNMNDEPLTTGARSAAAEALVGGWYGMASVKWLTRIVVLDKPHNGFFRNLRLFHLGATEGRTSTTGSGHRDSAESVDHQTGTGRSNRQSKAIHHLRLRSGGRERRCESGSQFG